MASIARFRDFFSRGQKNMGCFEMTKCFPIFFEILLLIRRIEYQIYLSTKSKGVSGGCRLRHANGGVVFVVDNGSKLHF